MLVTRDANEAIERAYREHGPRVWRAVFAYSGDPEIATDAVAEAFAQLLRRGDGVLDPVAWTWRAAFRIAAGELKERSRMTHEFDDRLVQMRDPAVDLISALGRLSPKQRAALVLHYFAGYHVKEIARILDSTPTAVKVHLSAGRKRLRTILKEVDNG